MRGPPTRFRIIWDQENVTIEGRIEFPPSGLPGGGRGYGRVARRPRQKGAVRIWTIPHRDRGWSQIALLPGSGRASRASHNARDTASEGRALAAETERGKGRLRTARQIAADFSR